jgi:hypothetical protein
VGSSDGVPLYALLYAKEPSNFQGLINYEVNASLAKLNPPNWAISVSEVVNKSIFCCLLGTSSNDAWIYDNKFLIREYVRGGMSWWQYRPLFPAVLTAYRLCLWDAFMTYLGNEERYLLEICHCPETTNDTRGRIFKSIVNKRCHVNGIEITIAETIVEVVSGSNRFDGDVLPILTAKSPDIIHIPLNPNFPAIDLAWKLVWKKYVCSSGSRELA